MPLEIEAKIKVENLDTIRARLAERSARHVADHLETNIFFDTEDRALLAGDRGLRIRRDQNLTDHCERIIITHKGPRMHGPFKSREETEAQVADVDSAAAILEKLGYSTVLSFEKRRQSWALDDCKVELDELPHLGCYVEVEGPDDSHVSRVLVMLGLAETAVVKSSYIAMLMTHLQEQGLSQRRVVFAANGTAGSP